MKPITRVNYALGKEILKWDLWNTISYELAKANNLTKELAILNAYIHHHEVIQTPNRLPNPKPKQARLNLGNGER